MNDLPTIRRMAAAALAAAVLLPPALVQNGPTLCAFRTVTGRPCPSCGMTRSWSAMGHGRVGDALGFHALGPVTFLTAAVLVAAGDERATRALQPSGLARPFMAALGAAWIGAWLWRIARGDRG